MGATNIRVQLTSFIGRERELVDVEQLFATSRLVTLTGPGGCGKTRLAVQAATIMSDHYRDGVWLVGLASFRDPALLPQFIIKTLGIAHLPEQPALEVFLNYVQSKQLLLLLDNCEHLIGECAELVQKLLLHASEARILATSREPLAIAGEAIYPLSGLAWPRASADDQVNDPQAFMKYDAVRLLVERTRAVLPTFALTPANVLSIAQICRQLDGLPLALELASARCNVLTFQQIAERLDDRFSLLVSRQRNEPDPRHHTLRATIDWSYELLSTPEQVLLRRLSVFAAGCTLETADAICAGNGLQHQQVLDLLSSLVNKSLVVAQTLQTRQAHYYLLETIRQYAQEKLIASGEWSGLRDRHFQFFLTWAEQMAPQLSGPDQQRWLHRLESEYDDIRVALAWSLESHRIEPGLQLAVALYRFWMIRGYVQEGLTWLQRLLAAADEQVSLTVRSHALAYAAFLAGFLGKASVQRAYERDAVAFAEAAGEQGKPALRWALAAQASSAHTAGDYQTEFTLAQQILQLNRELGDRYQTGWILSVGSFSAMSLGKYDVARAMLDEALPLLREAGDRYLVAMTINTLGDLARCERHYSQAQTAYEESLSLLRELGATRDLASVLHNLGYTCLHLGNIERAHTLFTESLIIHQQHENTPGIIECLLGFAALAVVKEKYAAAARLLGAAVAFGGQNFGRTWAATALEYEYYVARARAHLNETTFEAEQEAGRALSLEQAVGYAKTVAASVTATTRASTQPGALTVREREVASLIAQGKPNGDIAEQLAVSKRTVETHIANILSKLGFTNRAQIVRWAIETRLVTPTE